MGGRLGGRSLSYVGANASKAELEALRSRLDEFDCALRRSSERSVVFDDAYGVT
ncbi:hypothetical protein [Haloprofundus salinisoli]|uniref:hypothetical protein n=1 Tax=Haloprofundus salinisoli TaxID=2876193 RepID=UPI001CCA09D2|nr:hypothetical protein [Haloprofundus salinisoli]